MLIYLIISVLVNLALGFLSAFYVRRLIEREPQIVMIERTDVFLAELQLEGSPSDHLASSKQKTPQSAAQWTLPSDFLNTLEAESIEARSLVEATAQVMRLEVGKYRRQLISIENRIRETSYQPEEDALVEIADDLEAINVQWLDKQAEAAQCLDCTDESLEQYGDVARRLCETLFDQTAQIETTVNNLQQLNFRGDLGEVCRRLLIEIARLIDICHELRSRMNDTVATILRFEKRIGTTDPSLRTDLLTGMFNRLGIEFVYHNWLKSNSANERTLSVAVLDIDGFRKQNERIGTEAGDDLLITFAKYLTNLTRTDRAQELAMCLDGQRFLLFYGDNGPRSATSAVERIRQTIMATGFDFDGEEIDLRISAGIIEVAPKEPLPQLLSRAITVMQTAKRNGQNRTFLDEGRGAQAIQPPRYSVNSRLVPVV